MTNVIQFKRRVSGAAGAPGSLKSAEPAYNMADNTLYMGFGDDGGGNATSIEPVGGKGAFVDKASNQTIGGVKTFSTLPKSSDTPVDNDDLVTKGYADGLAGATYTAGDGLDLTGDEFSVDGTIARLASPALTGAPTAPTATPGTNTTQLASTAFVQAAVAALIDSSPGALDTLNELAAALGDDPDFATTVTTALAGKQGLDATLTALAGLSTAADRIPYFTGNDTAAVATLTAFARTLLGAANKTAARSTLGLGSMATQNASDVNITGGSIGSGVTMNANIDGGTF